jgi:cystathionine gamma-synthase
LALGADLVLHSATKFLGGHADAMGGVVCGSRELIAPILHYRGVHGATLDASSAYLLLRGMKTLKLRVEAQSKNALAVAEYLQQQPLVETVNYPGLPSHPHHALARQQMRDFGAVLSFSLRGDLDAARVLLPQLRIAHRAANLGSVETICGLARTTSHVECTPEERKAMGIPEGLVRLSVGIEDIDDIIADLEQGFKVLARQMP